MRGTTRAAFLVLILAGVFFMNTPANAAYGCEAFGDLTMGTMYENCYPDDPWFCFDGDNYCWQISPGFSCENAWYGSVGIMTIRASTIAAAGVTS